MPAPVEPRAQGAPDRPRIAVLIPCYNEELTVAEVVAQFRAELPDAEIYVFDNNSSDKTVEKARAAGATVMFERRQGKGYVVQSMFQRIDADYYVMVDGDSTYPAAAVHSPSGRRWRVRPTWCSARASRKGRTASSAR
jgi:cellulose synthase/poly-beta-1,6-N-acetylglucosamine synthase-like glycosyltransferase